MTSVPSSKWTPQMVINLGTLLIIHSRGLVMCKEIPSKKYKITNENLLYSTENSMICGDLNGKEI